MAFLRAAPPGVAAGIPARSHLLQPTKNHLSQVFAGQTVGIKQTDDRIWLVSFVDYDLGYFDDETCRLESPCKSLRTKSVTYVLGTFCFPGWTS